MSTIGHCIQHTRIQRFYFLQLKERIKLNTLYPHSINPNICNSAFLDSPNNWQNRPVLCSCPAWPDVLKLSHSSIIPGLIVVRMTDCYATKDRTLSLGESRPESGLKINSTNRSVFVNRLQCCLNLQVFLTKETLPAIEMYYYVTYFPRLRKQQVIRQYFVVFAYGDIMVCILE